MNADRGEDRFSAAAGWKLLRVNNSDTTLWLCAVTPEVLTYVYVPDSGRFHDNQGVYVDYIWDHELTYVPVTTSEARCLIESGVGRLPVDLPREVRERFMAADQIDVDDVFEHVREAGEFA